MPGPEQMGDQPAAIPEGSEWVLAAYPELDKFVRGVIELRARNSGVYPITAPHTACIFGDEGLAPGMSGTKAFYCIRRLTEVGILVPLPEKTKSGPDYYPTWDFPGHIPALDEQAN